MNGAAPDPAALLALRPKPVQGVPPGGSAVPGAFRAARRGQGHDMADLRSYVHGDDLRHLDPGATARTGELHVRAFHQDSDSALVLVADFRTPMLWGLRRAFRSVAVAEALVMAGWRAVDHGEKVGLAVIGDSWVEGLAPALRPDTMARVVGMLCDQHAVAAKTSGDPQTLAAALDKLARTLPRHARILLATGGDTPGEPAALLRLADRHALQVLRVGTGLERGLPSGRYPVLGQHGDWTGTATGDAPPLAAGIAELPLDPATPPHLTQEAPPWPTTPL